MKKGKKFELVQIDDSQIDLPKGIISAEEDNEQ